MQQEIKIAWSTPKSPDFDLREFVLGVLEIAKENLERDGELLPTVFIVTAESIECAPISFADHDEKTKVYSAVVDRAKAQSAVALITVNSGFMRNNFDADQLESYYPGKLEAEGASKCIMLTVSGPGIKNWCLDLPYEQTASGFEFSDVSEESGGELGFLDGWASDHAKVN
jgi:hypothetical protein